MDLRELKIQFLNAKVVTDDIKVKFRTHKGYTYYNCSCNIERYGENNALVIDLIDKTIPTFKVGDKVTNISGLFPEVGYTIAEVNEEEQYYTYKEVHGRTYFKDQNKLKLVEIKPKFKAGDKVKGVSSVDPEKMFIINFVNTNEKCYHYFNGKGIITMFKDQDKLTLVESDSSTTPVEDESVSPNIDVFIARQNVQIYNDKYYSQINKINKFIDELSKQGFNHYEATFIDTVYYCDKTGKFIPLAELIDRVNHHYTNLGFDVAVNKVKAGYKVLFKW